MHLRLFDSIPAMFTFAAARSYVVVAVFMLLSGGMSEERGWAATNPAWADLIATGKPPALCSVTVVSNDWLHARLFAGPISLAISAIAGFCACLLTTKGAAPSNSTFLRVHASMTTNATKSLHRSFCLLLGSCALAIAAKLQYVP